MDFQGWSDDAMRTGSRSTGELALALAGPTVWAVHFFLMYGAEVVICTGPAATSRAGQALPVAIALTVVAMVGLLCILVRRFALDRQAHQAADDTHGSLFWRDASTALAALAMLGVLWVALPAILLPACAPPAA
jgi:hypothetical protein